MRLSTAFSLLSLFLFCPPIASAVSLPRLSSWQNEERGKEALIALLNGGDDDESSADSDPKRLSSSASDSSSIEEAGERAQQPSGSAEQFVENVAGWRPPALSPKCPVGKFVEAKSGECRPCSICGPDLYELDQCRPDRDTVCEWCLRGNGAAAALKRDFRAKCEQLIALRDEFRRELAQRRMVDGHSKVVDYSRKISILESVSKWWRVELLIEMAFYVALIALVLAIIRFLLVKRRPTSYRTVTVTPPVLEEWEQKNIVRAAESIKGKLGGKGYAKLEEEFI